MEVTLPVLQAPRVTGIPSLELSEASIALKAQKVLETALGGSGECRFQRQLVFRAAIHGNEYRFQHDDLLGTSADGRGADLRRRPVASLR